MKPSLTIAQVRKEFRAAMQEHEQAQPSRANLMAAAHAVNNAMVKSIAKTSNSIAGTFEQRTEYVREYLSRVLPPSFFDIDEKSKKKVRHLGKKIITTVLTGEPLGLGIHAIVGALRYLVEQFHQQREADEPKGNVTRRNKRPRAAANKVGAAA